MFYKHISTVSTISILFLSLTSFTQGQSWSELFPTDSTSLNSAYEQTAVYDSTNNLMTIFGGNNDVWVLSTANGLGTSTWVQLSPTPDPTQTNNGWGGLPPPRDFHTAIYDSVNNRMTIYGGLSGTPIGDVWVLNHANGLGGTPAWTQLFPIGSSSTIIRMGQKAIYDAIHNRMIIFGGSNYIGSLNDVWALSNANGLDSTTSAWTQLFPTPDPLYGFPTGRYCHTAVYDVVNNRMTIFGGLYYAYPNTDILLNDVWVLSNANGLDSTTSAWTRLSPNPDPTQTTNGYGGLPYPRWQHTAVYDATNNRMTIFGGAPGLNDVWVLSNANGLGGTPAWVQLFPNPDPTQISNGWGGSPAPRGGHTAVYDNTNYRMTIFGGWDLTDIWVLSNADVLPVNDWMLYATESDDSHTKSK
jgi:hypothetical protein